MKGSPKSLFQQVASPSRVFAHFLNTICSLLFVGGFSGAPLVFGCPVGNLSSQTSFLVYYSAGLGKLCRGRLVDGQVPLL
jgi:hypothetical protein